ncbi:MAG: DUF6029 family protein, partial [Calditrichia bacterium]
MNRRLISVVTGLLIFFAVQGLYAIHLEFDGNTYLEYSIDRLSDKQYFEDWTDLLLRYKNWRLGVRYEAHLPPQPYSQDTSGHGISQRFIEYHRDHLNITAGNFYTLFGRGLVLRSFENRVLRWDTNIDGGKVEFFSNFADAKLIGGKPRDLTGKRHEVLYGGELNVKPLYFLNFGGSG